MTILAWHNDPALKADAVTRMKKHREQDEFVQGSYVDTSGAKVKGCFHGCLTAEKLAEEQGVPVGLVDSFAGLGRSLGWTSWHVHGERIWGIPRDLGELLDGIFEHQDGAAAAGEFAVAVTEAIPVGADLADVEEAFRSESDVARKGAPDVILRLISEAPVVAP